MSLRYGVSFSIKYARELGLDPLECLEALLRDIGVRRLRLMSYWDLHEITQGKYDFRLLDQQLLLAKRYGAQVSLCIGYRQPRYPETHQPPWALELMRTDKSKWRTALFMYIETTVKRYRKNQTIIEWQLENEALNRKFGINGEFDRVRLRYEKDLLKRLNPSRPICMSTSNSFGWPIRLPRPDKFGLSIYRVQYGKGYKWSKLPSTFFRARAAAILLTTGKRSFIHELQAEPWGPKATINLSLKEQFKSMDAFKLLQAVNFAERTGLYPIDLWGGEWWYWLLKKHKNPKLWETAAEIFQYKA